MLNLSSQRHDKETMRSLEFSIFSQLNFRGLPFRRDVSVMSDTILFTTIFNFVTLMFSVENIKLWSISKILLCLWFRPQDRGPASEWRPCRCRRWRRCPRRPTIACSEAWLEVFLNPFDLRIGSFVVCRFHRKQLKNHQSRSKTFLSFVRIFRTRDVNNDWHLRDNKMFHASDFCATFTINWILFTA